MLGHPYAVRAPLDGTTSSALALPATSGLLLALCLVGLSFADLAYFFLLKTFCGWS